EQESPIAAAEQRAHDSAEADAERDNTGYDATDPAALGGRHEFLHQRQVHAIETADADADEEAHERKIDPAVVRREIQKACRDGEVQHGADKDLAAADAVGEPAPDISADDGADAGAHQYGGGLPEGEFPRSDQEGEYKADQEVVEEFQRVADDCRSEDFDLVAGQISPAIEDLEHGVFFPWRMFVFQRASRQRSVCTGKATLSTRGTEACRCAGHLRINKKRATRRCSEMVNRAAADCGSRQVRPWSPRARGSRRLLSGPAANSPIYLFFAASLAAQLGNPG